MKVTALMTVLNGAQWIDRAISALEQQTWRELEILILDAGSTDSTLEIIHRHPTARLWFVPQRGIYAAWNKGLELSAGDFIVINNCDDWLEPTAVEKMATVLENNHNTELVYTDAFVHLEDGVVRELRRPEFDQYKFRQDCLVGASPMVRRRSILRAGKFREDYKVSGDWDMWCRLMQFGLFHHIDETLVHYSKRADSLEHRFRGRQVEEDAEIRQRYATR